MSDHLPKRNPKDRRRRGGTLLFLLLLPLMCAVIFAASRLGAINAEAGIINRQATPFETADYSPWNEIVFAPIDDALITQVVAEANGEDISFEGIATARPTIERRPPVGIPAIIAQNPTRVPPLNTNTLLQATSQTQDDATTIAQVPTETETTVPPVTATETDRPTATATVTDAPTATATVTDAPTATDVPPTSTPFPSSTPRIRRTDTPTPTLTPIVVATDIPAPSVNFGASPQTGAAPLTVNFIDLSSGDITRYSWNFGDGTTSSLASPSHTFSAPGSYYVRFDVFGPGGSAAAGVTINVTGAATATPIPQQPVQPPPNTNNDTDGDGILNDSDQCPNEGDLGFGLLGNGCPFVPRDSDGDGIPDPNDVCRLRGDEGFGITASGCPNPPTDADGDGVADNVDACPNQGDQGFGVAANGCPNAAPSDGDGDGVIDSADACPTQGDAGYGVGANGCPNPPTDGDGDGVFDNDDACPAQGDQGFGIDANGCPNAAPLLTINSITVVDTVPDTDIQTIAAGSTVNLTLSGNNRSIRVYPSADTNSITFTLNGSPIYENVPPYVIGGDANGDIAPWVVAPGNYTLVITAHSAANGNGNTGSSVTINLVVN